MSIEEYKNKYFLKQKISEQIGFIFTQINFAEPSINIHLNKPSKPDYTRMFFILFSLSRVYKYGLLTDNKDKVVKLFYDLFAKSKEVLQTELMRYVELYGQRFLNNLNIEDEICINSFKNGEYASLYKYPVITYVFLSAFFECDLKQKYLFSESLKNAGLANIDYLLFSENRDSKMAFHFSEISAWKGFIPDYLLGEGVKATGELFERDAKNDMSSSSGIAKVLEHFARIDDVANFEKGLQFLEKRIYKRFGNFMNPKFANFSDKIYTENSDSQYICLDTSAHLLNAYINFYEKL